jgi:hypothetical protein
MGTSLGRIACAVLLLLAAGFCAIQAVAAGEQPEARSAYWVIDGIVGLACLSGASWLLWRKRPAAG